MWFRERASRAGRNWGPDATLFGYRTKIGPGLPLMSSKMFSRGFRRTCEPRFETFVVAPPSACE